MSDLDDQKLIFFFVPNYDGTNGDETSGSPLSYVKLGSAKSHESIDTADKRGDDLLEAAGLGFIDDERGESCEDKVDDEESPYSGHTHYDHEHEADECLALEVEPGETVYYRSTAQSVYTSEKSKDELTAEILGEESTSTDARGGYRDHTDGNRIVTVRGDRVDVVVGNYKRVVFGRVSGDHVGASSYEASGGHLFERTSTGTVELYAIEHVEETDDEGKPYWKIVERGHHADSVYRYSGTLSEHHNGPVRITTIGVDAESDEKNPEITRTSNVDELTSKVTADSLSRTIDVDTLEDTTHADEASLDETIEAHTYERLRGKKSQRSFTFKEELWCQTAIDIKVFVGAFETRTGGAFFDDELDEMRMSMGVSTAIHVGPRFKFHYGSDTRVHFPLVLKATIGAAAEVDVGFYGQTSLLYWSYVAAEGAYRIGDLEVEYVRKEDSVADSRAFALLAHL